MGPASFDLTSLGFRKLARPRRGGEARFSSVGERRNDLGILADRAAHR
jgi:hypothetical protein